MPISINIYKESDNLSFASNNKDSINHEKITRSDTIISSRKFIEDSIEVRADLKDSIPVISKTKIHDSIIIDSARLEIKQKVTGKFNEYLSSETSNIKVYTNNYSTEKIAWNTSENFLAQSINNDTGYLKNSIFTSPFQNNGNLRSILVTGKNISFEPIKRNDFSNDWLLAIFLSVILLFLWVKIFYKKYFVLLLSSLLSYQLSLKLMREKNILTKRVSFVLNFVYTIVLSLFILKVLEFYQIKIFNFNTFETLLILINLIIIISVIRILVLNLVGFIFNSTQIFNEYIHNNYIINKNLGLFLFPLLITQVYMSEKIEIIFIIMGISLIFLSFIIRFYRGFQIIIKKEIFLFYLILYLCTLEILPILLGYKFFILLV